MSFSVIRLGIKSLAKYMTASPASQRKILLDAKYPNEDEPYAMRLYYREATERIVAYHRNDHEENWLLAKADDLAQLATFTGGNSATRLRHNSRALRQYKQVFASRRFVPQSQLRLSWDVDQVRISVVPELYVLEGAKAKVIKLDFSSNQPDEELIRIISQATYEAGRGRIPNLTNSSILYFDVPRGREHRGARAGSRMIKEIEAACTTISTVWDSISPSRR
jgi:hypothetical protein